MRIFLRPTAGQVSDNLRAQPGSTRATGLMVLKSGLVVLRLCPQDKRELCCASGPDFWGRSLLLVRGCLSARVGLAICPR